MGTIAPGVQGLRIDPSLPANSQDLAPIMIGGDLDGTPRVVEVSSGGDLFFQLLSSSGIVAEVETAIDDAEVTTLNGLVVTARLQAFNGVTMDRMRGDVNGLNIQWGAATYAAPTNVSVGTSTTEILAVNTSRRAAIIVNDGADDIYIGIGGAAVVGSGIRLNSGGGSLVIGGGGGVLMTTQAINGISNTAAQNVTVHEAT